jgi:hypothetical protein
MRGAPCFRHGDARAIASAAGRGAISAIVREQGAA